MVAPSDDWECDGAERESCRPDMPAAFGCCICDCADVRLCAASKAESYLLLTSCASWPSGDICSLISDALIGPEWLFDPCVAAAAAAATARSFFDAFPRFLRSRAYSQVNPNSVEGSVKATSLGTSVGERREAYQCNGRTGAARRIWFGVGYTGHTHG